MNLMNVKKTAEYLSLGRSTVYHWISQDCIPVLPSVHGKRLLDRDALDHWIRNGSPKYWREMIKEFYQDQERAQNVLVSAANPGPRGIGPGYSFY